MAKKTVKTVKKVKSNNDIKIKIWKTINLLIILVCSVLFAAMCETIGIAAVAANAKAGEEFKLTVEIVKNANMTMNKAITFTGSLYVLIHLVNYLLYLFNMRRVLRIAVIAELIVTMVGATYTPNYIIVLVPLLSALIYLRILSLERK